MSILIENISKTFGTFRALDHVNLEVKAGSLVALVGPSGSGKSTLLRMIAGLERADEGKIWLAGRDATYAPIQKRHIGFVFQNYALFKHLNVAKNISFGLEVRQANPNQIRSRVRDLLQLIQLEHMADRYPAQLSGGQRQRVALARALAVEPKVLLLDEPFGALDARVRRELRSWLRDLHQEMPVTTVFVTHDQQEAMEVAHEIVVFNQGRLEQVGSPQEIYDHPATPFVMGFMGHINHGVDDVQQSSYFVRPNDVIIQLVPSTNSLSGKVVGMTYGDTSMKLDVDIPQQVPSSDWAPRGSLWRIHLSRRDFNQFNSMLVGGIQIGSVLYVQPRRTEMVRGYSI
uniref:Sulfate/thiosulfate import ATP-binding protein CysA n=1 Tax=Nephroselmis olivacea TaxID=31312 RepID=CYSA_NEPOL|nr:probable transport protein [Nephroselmis olivacea]Q9TKX3.1 RecName: Full=Sulfate/thiosulfate import ATP-binding protein CysA; AltName: Full=Sulfate-transporting ATPase [Nephroselmis olivacea]AAD54843.1 probable transport protein [Nephroselmis olivacea]